MGEVLVLVEQEDGSVRKATSEMLTLARRLGEPSAVWVGPGISEEAVAALGEFGATTVYVAGDEALTKHPVAPTAEVLAQLVAEKASPVADIAYYGVTFGVQAKKDGVTTAFKPAAWNEIPDGVGFGHPNRIPPTDRQLQIQYFMKMGNRLNQRKSIRTFSTGVPWSSHYEIFTRDMNWNSTMTR